MGTRFSDILDPRDLPAALGLLSRLPIRVDPARAEARGGRAAWAWPLAGAAIGAIAGGAAWAALALGLTPGLAALLALAAQVIVTGALHEDGLADSADGLWGGWTRDRRLEIMRDSRIGAYGVIALILSLLIRWQALALALAALPALPVLIAAAALSRAPMAVLMWRLPNARDKGLSASVGAPPASAATLGVAVSLGAALLCLGGAALVMAIAVAAAAFGWALIARAKIGGQTGDILGAAQQLSEIAALLALAALV